MYELSTGRELDKEVPLESDFELVSRGSRERVQDLMGRIFSMSEKVRNGTESYESGLKTVSTESSPLLSLYCLALPLLSRSRMMSSSAT